jgi:hypothetical protein
MTSGPLPVLIRLRVTALRVLAALYLAWENIARALWPFGLWCAGFASLWLLQIPQLFGQATEIIASLVFIFGGGTLFLHRIRRIRLPHHRDVTRRIEQDNHLSHRPLSGLEDSLANPTRAETRRLWSLWQGRLHPALLSLQWPRPCPLPRACIIYSCRGHMGFPFAPWPCAFCFQGQQRPR